VGKTGAVGATRGEKNRKGEERAATIQLVEELFSACHPPVKYLMLPGGSKNRVCEVNMGAKFGEEYFNCHGSL